MDFSRFISESRKIRENSFRYGAYPITEEEALIMYTVVFERAVILKGLNIVEVGSGCGYSGIWFLKALKDSGYLNNSQMVMIEQNRTRSKIIMDTVKKLGFSDYVIVKTGDAKEILRTIRFPINIVFIDAAKHEYHIYLKLLEPNLVSGSIVFAHNYGGIYSYSMKEYAEMIMERSKYISSPLPTPLSLAISIKR